MTSQQLQEKLKRYLSYLDQDKGNINLLLSVSDCCRQLNDWASAQQYLDVAQQLSGQHFWTHQGFLYLDTDKMLLAKESFRKALAEEDTPLNRYHLGFCLYVNQEFEAALAVFNFPDNVAEFPECVRLKARLLHRLQRIAEAIILLQELLAHHESDADAMGLLALLYLDNDELQQAELFSNKTLSLDHEHYEGQLVRILFNTSRNKATVEEINALLKINPQEGRLLFALGATYLRQMNLPEAEQALLEATQILPYFYDNWIHYGWCHIVQNNLEQAEKAYQKATIIDANTADGWGGLALVSTLSKHRTQAETLLEKAFSLDPECLLAIISRIILANDSDPKQAIKLLKAVMPEAANQIYNAILILGTDETIMH